MARAKGVVVVSERQRAILERLARAKTVAQQLVERAQIILLSANGKLNVEQAEEIGVDPQRIRRWRRRWAARYEGLHAAEEKNVKDRDLEALINDVLSDGYRSGTPARISAEQVAQIIALACEQPSASGRPVSHWTPRELADEAIKRGIVDRVSPRHVARFLEDADLRPHRSRYWLNAKTKEADPEKFATDVQAVCTTYETAAAVAERGGHVVSCDEKTGIQALERIASTKPVAPGLIERFEFEYIRHGTLCLTANFDVVTGRIVSHTIAATRTEADFAEHVIRTVATDPAAEWVFVSDQLNTHKSATLVEQVAALCGNTDDLGVKGESGILENMPSRAAFLADPAHRVRFVYTPKHCSWLHQVEIWFSVLARRLLKRSSFASIEALRSQLEAFIAYFNATLAKPYRWTYTGRALRAA